MLGAGLIAQTYLGGAAFVGTPTPPIEQTKGYARSSSSAANGAKASNA
jgi:hypothetical protein